MHITPPLSNVVVIPWRQKEKDSVISYKLGSSVAIVYRLLNNGTLNYTCKSLFKLAPGYG